MYDVVIIGAGVTGSAAARELSRYNLNICVVEKEEDVCCGTSKANSGIVHSGIDCIPGTLMAQMNILGNRLMEPLSKELDFPFKRNGSLILCFSKEDLPRLEELFQRGITSKIPNIRILNKEELHEMEPNISDEAIAAIYAPTGGIVCPFGMNISMAENAAANGVEFKFDTEIKNITKNPNGYTLETDNNSIETRCVVNAAGVHADTFHNMVSQNKIHITARRGEYCLLDKTAGNLVSKTIFQLPGKYGKGILVTPTVHGNTLIGPTANDHENKDSTRTTADGLSHVCEAAKRSIPSIPVRQIITSFSGNRAHEDHHEFIIEELADAPCFIDAAGIESPGLTSAPAIGIRIAEIVCNLLKPAKNPNFDGTRKGILDPKTLSEEEYAALIKDQPAYGNIICRCEMITEGEILDAIHRPLGAKSLDGIKRRTRAGMGRCQAGFCSPKTMEILARELQVSLLDITKNGGNSHMVIGYTKNAEEV
ncbi:MAG: NAD(P)/FAD-dependent oxidoreductase [Lachnospiraceae bacterium]|nr:NAD(P)/FAD-dependent oxidoreductase [Lachnospiraceae bacterium]